MIIHKFSKYGLLLMLALLLGSTLMASSHREAPLIANDPLADNTDLYAFRNPRNPRNIVIIANYVPMQLPHGGPNYYSFGENIRYEIHIDNDASKPGDEIIYRFTFSQRNEDPSTFFNIRLGKQNLKTTYRLEKSINGGRTFLPILVNGNVPPPRIGERSISSPVGLNTTYGDLFRAAVRRAHTGENVFCGPVDDPFFVDLGGVFDLGDAPRQDGEARDGLECMNVNAIALEIPIRYLLKKGAGPAEDILDPDYVIGVWASASRPRIRTLEPAGEKFSGDWVQVSRLGMPLTNEAVIPIGMKDYWNSLTPYQELEDDVLDQYFYNPELALYMDDALFGGAVPAFAPLRIQRNSLQSFDFGNGQDGLYGLKGSPAVAGTALDDAIFGNLLLPGPGMPRSVDLWPIFHTGVPNFPPYQLATGKGGNPLAAGKPFINNFLPNGGDMLRLNMAVPPTPRDHPQFSSLGIIQAAVLGLTDPAYNTSSALQFIPNMDGFPNGRRMEDDVTRIELQAVAGVALAAIGLWYDDYTAGSPNPVTQDLVDVLSYSTGVEENDKQFINGFPFVGYPFAGDGECSGVAASASANAVSGSAIGLSAPAAAGQKVMMGNYPNPFHDQTTIRYQVDQPGTVNLSVYDLSGRRLEVLANSWQEAGEYQAEWNASNYPAGVYFLRAESADGKLLQVLKLVKVK
ncbi:MAG: DUF4331 family protein [Phaeodactylibacter sp.]|nr:DUF4331 family protein [Phaeodactylibacter sp.]MCB9048233.1 DUF4331 family protein [Lewinellaceae bacterium]